MTLIFVLGLVFEMPIVAYFFASIGLLTTAFFVKYRKFAIVLVLVAAALITPSSDVFTMLLSRIVVKKVERKKLNHTC